MGQEVPKTKRQATRRCLHLVNMNTHIRRKTYPNILKPSPNPYQIQTVKEELVLFQL